MKTRAIKALIIIPNNNVLFQKIFMIISFFISSVTSFPWYLSFVFDNITEDKLNEIITIIVIIREPIEPILKPYIILKGINKALKRIMRPNTIK